MSAEPEIKSSPAWTASDLIKHIPPRWRGARVFISDDCGKMFPVKRVGLHTNRDGRAVIVFSPGEIQP